MKSRLSLFIIVFLISFGSEAQVNAFLNVDQNEGCDTLKITTTSEFLPAIVDSMILDFGNGYADTIINPTYGQTNTYTYDSIGDYTISLTVFLNSDSAINSTLIHVYPYPDASFDYNLYGYPSTNDTFFYSNKHYLFISQYPNDTTHTWLINNIQQYSQIDSMGYNFTTIGVQNITHTVVIHGCSSTSEQSMGITSEEIKIPNIFSPNNDGINDVFYIQTDGEIVYKLTVLDRNGSRVFLAEGKVISWDGRSYWGEQLSPGNYYYYLEPSFGEKKTGIIYLAR